MRNPQRVNQEWRTPEDNLWTWDHVAIEVLQDIRYELRRLNSLLHCHNFTAIPSKLERIARNTKRPVRRKP